LHEQGATEFLANLSVGSIVLAAFVLTIVRLLLVPSQAAIARSAAELVESFIIAGVLVFLIIRPFFVQAFFIPSESMEPTLMGHTKGLSMSGEVHQETIHDHIFVNKLAYRIGEPKRGDIIVFRAEKRADSAGGFQTENVLIKRLIAVPGDRIAVLPNPDSTLSVWLNGEKLNEPYIKEPMYAKEGGNFGVGKEITLKPGELYVMGDNRNNSNDSRFWGTLPRNRVIGKAFLRFWPLNRVGLVK